MSNTTAIILAVLAAGIMIAAAVYGAGKSDRVDCIKWQHEAQQYPGFYLTTWQKQQCDYWNIKVAAPVK